MLRPIDRAPQDRIVVSEETTTMHATKRITPEAGGFAAYVNELRIGWRAAESAARELASEAAYDVEHDRAPAIEAQAGPAIPPLHMEYRWEDANGDLTDTPTGTLAGTEYHLEDDASHVAVSLYANHPAEVYLFGRWISAEVVEIEQTARNLQALLAHPTVAAARGGVPPAPIPPAPAVQVKPMYYDAEGDLTYKPGGPVACFDFIAGDGLTKAVIGTYTDWPGIELIIGGSCINGKADEVLTLADVRQLRDNLTALLNDERLVAECVRVEADAPQKPARRAA